MITDLKLYALIGLAGIAAIVGAVFWYNSQIENAKEEAVKAVETQYKLDLAEANARATQLETSLNNTKKELTDALALKNVAVEEQAVKTETVIKTIIQENPIYKECKVDAVVLDELNMLRRVGNE